LRLKSRKEQHNLQRHYQKINNKETPYIATKWKLAIAKPMDVQKFCGNKIHKIPTVNSEIVFKKLMVTCGDMNRIASNFDVVM
jgi:hypothetical protein